MSTGNDHESFTAAISDRYRDLVYSVLVNTCGAHDDESNRAQWDAFWNSDGREYRFIGTLGFGGKFWRANRRWYVNCYPEHRTPERDAVIAVANAELEALYASV